MLTRTHRYYTYKRRRSCFSCVCFNVPLASHVFSLHVSKIYKATKKCVYHVGNKQHKLKLRLRLILSYFPLMTVTALVDKQVILLSSGSISINLKLLRNYHHRKFLQCMTFRPRKSKVSLESRPDILDIAITVFLVLF